jgi:DnaK suppressor protein
MKDPRLALLHGRLEARRRELRDLIAAGEKADVPIAPDSSLGRLTRVDALQAQQMAAALLQRNREELSRVDRALRRMEAGEYGLCVRCGEAIAEARLHAVPDAVLCLDCAERPRSRQISGRVRR